MAKNQRAKSAFVAFVEVAASVLALSMMITPAPSASAVADIYQDFDPGDIINDYTMGNYQTMSESQIQAWLTAKNPCSDTNVSKVDGYKGYKWHIEDGHFVCLSEEKFLIETGLPDYAETGGETKTAAEIIYEASQTYRINPQVLLVLLQKEQGLITDTYPNNIQYRSATGYGCPDTAACSSKYYGFINQIDNAAAMFRSVLDGGWSNYPLGINKIKYHPNSDCGTKKVDIQNAATSVLYRYTPYVPNKAALNTVTGKGDSCSSYGNRNFYYYFTTWFGSTHTSFKPSSVSQVYIQEGIYQLNGTNYQILRTSGGYRLQEPSSQRYLDLTDPYVQGSSPTLNELDETACSQKWLIRMEDGKFVFRSYCSGFALTTNGTISEYLNDDDTQKFELIRISGTIPLQDGEYSVVSSLGKALAPLNGSTENNASVALYNKSGNDIQAFTVTREPSGLYRFQDKKTGKYLSVKGASQAAGASVIYYDTTGSCSSRWIIKNQGTYYQIISACSGKSLDVPAKKIGTVKTPLTIQKAATDNGQRWNFAPTTFTELVDGEYHNIFTSAGLLLAIKNDSSKDGAKIILAEPDNDSPSSEWQKFRFTKTSDGYYTIMTIDKKLLYVPNNTNAVKIQQYKNLKACNQKFWIVYNSDKTYSIRSACWTDRALAVANRAIDVPGKYIISYKFLDDPAERFTIK